MKTFLRWWANPRIPISPERKLQAAWIILLISFILWPVAAFTFAADEPPAILALSFLAITITCVDIIVSSDVSAEVSVETDEADVKASARG